jgi:hypothetical protein
MEKEIKVMQKNIQNTIEKVSNSFPSLFSREDVIKLLTDLNAEMQEESPKPQIDKEDLLTNFRQMLSERDWEEVVDKDDIELSLSYNNQIEIESVPIDEDFLVRSAVDTLEALWDVLTFDPLEGEED